MKKIRLDELLVIQGHCTDLQHARGILGAGDVFIDGHRVDKAGIPFSRDTVITIRKHCPYVSRGGLKMKGAIDGFPLDPKGMTCADIGASSGGFTDCLLQHGAEKVYAVDVAYGQLDWKLRQDKRVVVLERFNARKLSSREIPDPLDLAVMDASFISLAVLIPPLLPLFRKQIQIVCLVKPQFELPRELVPKGGVVKNPEHHQLAVTKVTKFVEEHGLQVTKSIPSPILGPKGNREFLLMVEGNR